MAKRVDFVNAPSGSIGSHQRFMIGVGLDPVPLSNRVYMLCSSVEPDLLDTYVDDVLVERLDGIGIPHIPGPNNTYMRYESGALFTYVDGNHLETNDITNMKVTSTGPAVLDFFNGVTLVERTTAA